MKLLRLAVAATFLLGFSSAYAFHSGGVAECGGCHAMHKADSAGAIIGASQHQPAQQQHRQLDLLRLPLGSDPEQLPRPDLPAPGGRHPAREPHPGWRLRVAREDLLRTSSAATPPSTPRAATGRRPRVRHQQRRRPLPGRQLPGRAARLLQLPRPARQGPPGLDGHEVAVATNKVIGSGSYPTLATPATGEEAISAYGTYRLLYTNNSYYSGTGYAGPVPAGIPGRGDLPHGSPRGGSLDLQPERERRTRSSSATASHDRPHDGPLVRLLPPGDAHQLGPDSSTRSTQRSARAQGRLLQRVPELRATSRAQRPPRTTRSFRSRWTGASRAALARRARTATRPVRSAAGPVRHRDVPLLPPRPRIWLPGRHALGVRGRVHHPRPDRH